MSLVGAHEDEITLASSKTGSTIYNPRPRGVGTFLSIGDYPFDDWRRRSRRKAVAELAVRPPRSSTTTTLDAAWNRQPSAALPLRQLPPIRQGRTVTLAFRIVN